MPKKFAQVDHSGAEKQIKDGIDSIIAENNNEVTVKYSQMYQAVLTYIQTRPPSDLTEILKTKLKARFNAWYATLNEYNKQQRLAFFSTQFKNFLLYRHRVTSMFKQYNLKLLPDEPLSDLTLHSLIETYKKVVQPENNLSAEVISNLSNIREKIQGNKDHRPAPEDQPSDKIIQLLYYSIIFNEDSELIRTFIISDVLDLIESYRATTDTNYDLASVIVESLYKIKSDIGRSYEIDSFNEQLTAKTAEYYQEKKRENCKGDINNYIRFCIEVMHKEEGIAKAILDNHHSYEYLKTIFEALVPDDLIPSISQPNSKEINICPTILQDDLVNLKWLTSMWIKFDKRLPSDNSYNKSYNAIAQYIGQRMLEFIPHFTSQSDDAPKAKPVKKGTKKVTKVVKKGTAAQAAAGNDDASKPATDKPVAANSSASGSKPAAKSAKNSDSSFKNIEELVLLANHLIDNYKKVYPTKPCEEILNKCVTKAWNDKAFEPERNFPEFINFHIRNGLNSLNKELQEFSNFSNLCCRFAGYIQEKIIFANYYQQLLIKRIIKDGNKNKQIETDLINALKKLNIKNDFCTQVDEQFRKVETSHTLHTEFQQSDEYKSKKSEVTYLPTVFAAENLKDLNLKETTNIMPFIKNMHQAFVDFCKKKEATQTFHLIPDISTMEFSFTVPEFKGNRKTTYKISCDLFCGYILQDLYECADSTVENIVTKTGIEKQYVEKYLEKLTKKPLKLLKYNVDSKGFSLNDHFKYNQTSFTIPSVDIQSDALNQKSEQEKIMLIRSRMVIFMKRSPEKKMKLAELKQKVLEEVSKYARITIDEVDKELMIQLEQTKEFITWEDKEKDEVKYIA